MAAPARGDGYIVTDLGALEEPVSAAFAANYFGQVVGVSTAGGADLHGFFWDAGMTGIAPLANDTQAHALAINDSGQVAAMSYAPGGLVVRGLRWQGGTTTDLGDIAPRGIGVNGEVVGYISFEDAAVGWVDHAAKWQNGVVTDLGTLGGNFSYAHAVDGMQRIVGMSFSPGNKYRRACLWLEDASLMSRASLWSPPSVPIQMDAGMIVGFAETLAGEPHACLFEVDEFGEVVDRTDLARSVGTATRMRSMRPARSSGHRMRRPSCGRAAR